jgi:hypothetical protein
MRSLLEVEQRVDSRVLTLHKIPCQFFSCIIGLRQGICDKIFLLFEIKFWPEEKHWIPVLTFPGPQKIF